MARGRFNKILEFIGLVDDEPDTGYGGQGGGGQVYNPPQRRAPDSARPVRQQSYAAGGYPTAQNRDYDGYRSRQPDPRAAYRSTDRPDYRSAPRALDRFDRDQPYDARQSRADYAPRASQPYRAPSAAVPTYQPDPIRDEFERIDRPQQPQPKGNVVSMRSDSRHQTVIYYLHTLEECRDVITDLIDNKTVLLNLEEMEEHNIQRGIDTLCGAAFALGATLRKASDKTYLIAPNNVDVALTSDAERRY
jgi:FtsZ-interacting cell division protein YlmF